MAYNETLAQRVTALIGAGDRLQQRKMFGGLALLLNGNMCCGIHGDELILRVEPDKYETLLARPNVRRFDMTGRPMKGWLTLGRKGCAKPDELKFWVKQCVDFAAGLRAKKKSQAAARRQRSGRHR